ncbi:MAG TPA: hypothetical protein VGG82_13460 [Casimicrobiaceae bacterium]
MPQLPKSQARKLPNQTRRTLLKAGIAGGVVLALARWIVASYSPRESPEATGSALDYSSRAIIAAIVPVLLEGALPDPDTSVEARAEVVAGVDRAVAGLPPGSRKELEQLFALLSFAPTRCLVAGVWSSWPDASRESVAAFLVAWRDSRFTLLRSGYGALRQLILAAWYGNTRSWPAIGYPGPPSLEIG